MGYVRVTASVGNSADNLHNVRFLVDTGAFYTALSPLLVRELQLPLGVVGPVITADNRTVNVQYASAYLRLMGRDAGIWVAVMDCPEPLLGVTALEALGLKVNPVAGTLEHDRPYAAAMLTTGEPNDG
jgi:clan AA aspartic protease